jgi:hypothetical protein
MSDSVVEFAEVMRAFEERGVTAARHSGVLLGLRSGA